MADRVTRRLVGAALTDVHRNLALGFAEIQRAAQKAAESLARFTATIPEARAYAAFVADGGNPELIHHIEEMYHVEGMPRWNSI